MPLTDNEVHFSENETLVSKTDLNGIISFVNQEFIDISGFSKEELIGKDLNLVWHPDMPPEVFEDLWDTIKQGKPWIQLVKNRCKNGDFFWVKANATPEWKNGQVVGYMSVRTKPSSREIADAQKAHQLIKDKKLKLLNGNLIKPGFRSLTHKLNNIKVTSQLFTVGVVFMCLVGLIGWNLLKSKEVVNFSVQELIGTRYITPLIQLLQLIPQHRGMTDAYLNGNQEIRNRILDHQAKVESAFDQVSELDKKYGDQLSTSQRLEKLRGDWHSLKTNALSLDAKQSYARHSSIIIDIQNLIIHTGHSSHLVLDPELDTFYAMDLVTNRLPQVVELMEQARGLASAAVAEGGATEQQRNRLMELIITLKIAEHGVQSSYNEGTKASVVFSSALGDIGEQTKTAIAYFSGLVEQIRNGQYRGTREEIFAAGSQAIDLNFKLYVTTNHLLKTLLEHRITGLENSFYIISTLTVLAVFLIAIIGFTVIRNMVTTLNASIDNLAAISVGDYSQELAMNGNNELSALTRAITLMRIKTGFEILASKRKAQESSRIKQALDVCDTNVMMADANLNIVYMNNSATKLFHDTEQELRNDLVEFDASKLIGANVAVFEKNPEHRNTLVKAVSETYRSEAKIGGRTFILTVTPVFDNENARLGTVVEWADKTEELAQIAQERRISNENLRIRQALDNVSANVMLANPDRDIIYMNRAVYEMLKNAQPDIQTEVSDFNVDNLLGNSIDIFQNYPDPKQNIFANLNQTHKTSLAIGGRSMDLTVSPVHNEEGERLGTAVEWQDRTAEIAVEQEIDSLVDSAARGDLTNRIPLEGKRGFFLTLSKGLNELVGSAASILNDVGKTFAALAEGDLTNSIEAQYQGDFEQIKNNANLTNEKLSKVIREIRESANTVNTAANELAQGNADLSQRTEEQASSLEETASSMEQMTSTVKQSSDSAKEADLLSKDARRKAQDGGEVVKQAIDAMEEILKASNKINDIIGVIDEIAFQTNLLALNAAVEAARAGEQGRGFAVVAGEVRNLSQRSAAAAKEIKDLIKDSVGKVETGSVLVNESGETLTSIVHAVENVASMIAEISNASSEQTSGIEQINQAITQMDEMTQQNAALVEQASASSEAMSDQAGNMSKLVSFFKLGNTPHPQTNLNEPLYSFRASLGNGKFNNTAGRQGSFADDGDWEEF